MSAALLSAVRNNIAWCDAVVKTHGGDAGLTATHWINTKPSPRFYPNLITLTPGDAGAQHEAIASLATHLAPGFGVKDSFAALDLSAHGFKKLFDAIWLWRPSALPSPTAELPGLRWQRVTNRPRLLAWERGFADDEEPQGLFRAPLLADPDIAILGAWNRDDARGGAIFNRHAGATGITNVFAPHDLSAAFLKALVREAAAFANGQPLVTYVASDAEDWQVLGFEPLGPLCIWIKS